MPVEINEPLSFLQRLAEIMEYSDLLEQAAAENDPVRRMQFVTAFAVASLSSNLERLRKPFNPILGETYELNRWAFINILHLCRFYSSFQAAF